MTIAFDCLRDLLKMVADSSGDTTIRQDSYIAEKYTWGVVEHTVNACKNADLFLRVDQYITDDFCISGLSISGAEKLSSIESDTKWSKIKPLLIAAGAKTVDMMFSIAAGVATSAL